MEKYIDGINFFELEAEKYFAPPSSWSQEKKEEWARTRIFSGEWYGAQKRDGAFFMFLKDEDGNMFLRPRARNVKKEFVNKIDWVPHLHSFFEKLPNGTCFLGEIWISFRLKYLRIQLNFWNFKNLKIKAAEMPLFKVDSGLKFRG